MAKASPLIRSFNAGEVSELVQGRTDLDRYPSSNRKLFNYVAAPQGPAIPRSGTEFLGSAYKDTEASILSSFIFSETEAYVIEFCGARIRFFNQDGILVRSPVVMNVTSASPFTFTAVGLNAAVGDQVAFGNFPNQYNLNAVVGNVLTKVGDTYTVDTAYPALAVLTGVSVALVYSIPSPYTYSQLSSLRDLQSLDVVYLTHPSVRPYKLKRRNTYDWSFEAVRFTDGPYIDVNDTTTSLTPSVTGNAIPIMTSNSAPSGIALAGTASTSFPAWMAFDGDVKTT